MFLHQEQILTSPTKAIVKHCPTQSFFLNTYSIHNYIHIKSVLPEALHNSPIRVTDANAIQKLAVAKLKEKQANQGITSADTTSTGPDNQHSAFEPMKKPQAKAKGKAKAKSPPVASHSIPGPSVASSSMTCPSVASPSVARFHVSSPPVTSHFAAGHPAAAGLSATSYLITIPSATSHPITISSATSHPITIPSTASHPVVIPFATSHPVAIPSTASYFSAALSPHFPLQPTPQLLPTPYMVPTHIYSLPVLPPTSGAAYHPSNHSFARNIHFTSPLSVPQFSQPGPAYHQLASVPSSHLFTENPLHGTTDPSLVNPYQVLHSPLAMNSQYSTMAAPGALIGMGPHQHGNYLSTVTHYNSTTMFYAPPH